MEGITITMLKCLYSDCEHEWTPRFARLPKVCPKCKRYDWNKPHVGAGIEGGARDVKKSRSSRKQPSLIERFKRTHESKKESIIT